MLFGLCLLIGTLIASGGRFSDVALTRDGFTTTPALALVGWLGFINAALFLFNIVPAFPLDGGRIARALIWWRSGDRNRATRATGRAGQGFALALAAVGLWGLASGSSFGLITIVLAFFLYQAAGAAVVMLASLVKVTVNGLLAWPLAATTKGEVRVWEEPLVPVAKFQMTALGVEARHPVCVVLRALVVYPVAYVVLVGSWTAVIVTG